MARNCHKAAYHAALLNNLEVSYLYPAADMTRGLSGAIAPDEVERMLKRMHPFERYSSHRRPMTVCAQMCGVLLRLCISMMGF